MPYRHNPDRFPVDSIRKSVWSDNDLAMRKIGKLRYRATGIRKLLQALEHLLGLLSKSSCRRRVVSSNEFQTLEKLAAG